MQQNNPLVTAPSHRRHNSPLQTIQSDRQLSLSRVCEKPTPLSPGHRANDVAVIQDWLTTVYMCMYVCVQSLLEMHEEMVTEGHLHGDLVRAASASHRHDSVTTACQTELSGEVSCVVYVTGL